jgi:hypothetical protein
MFGNRAPELFVSLLPRRSQAAPSAYDVAARDHQERVRRRSAITPEPTGFYFRSSSQGPIKPCPQSYAGLAGTPNPQPRATARGSGGRPQLHVVSTQSGGGQGFGGAQLAGSSVRSYLKLTGCWPLTFKHKALARLFKPRLLPPSVI